MNVSAVFRPLSDLEKSMADLYTEWAALFDDDRDAAFLWVKMANEERGHLARLKEFAASRGIEVGGSR